MQRNRFTSLHPGLWGSTRKALPVLYQSWMEEGLQPPGLSRQHCSCAVHLLKKQMIWIQTPGVRLHCREKPVVLTHRAWVNRLGAKSPGCKTRREGRSRSLGSSPSGTVYSAILAPQPEFTDLGSETQRCGFFFAVETYAYLPERTGE